eukprot:gene49002-42403_t
MLANGATMIACELLSLGTLELWSMMPIAARAGGSRDARMGHPFVVGRRRRSATNGSTGLTGNGAPRRGPLPPVDVEHSTAEGSGTMAHEQG